MLLWAASATALSADSPLFSVESALALLTLTIMEIVLGIDNIVFIAIISARLPPEKRSLGRRIGLLLAMGMRIVLLLAIGWIISLTEPILYLSQWAPSEAIARWITEDMEIDAISARDLILLGGGLFLIYSSVREIHAKVEGGEHADGHGAAPVHVSLTSALFRIAMMDLIFSLDSVLTAVGMAKHVPIMITAVVISVLVMVIFANQISDFVHRHPTVKMLALSFLLLIGVVLISEGVGTPIHKGYVYFAMAFSMLVESLNLKAQRKRVESIGKGV